METRFLVIFTFLLLQRLGASSESMMTNSSSVTCIERERKSLLIFKERLTYGYRRLSTWTGVECCEWVGVHCDKRSGHVIRRDLRTPRFFDTDNQLGGEVSPSLLNLKHLRYLDLSMNYFLGHIPKFLGSFKHLEYLNLSCSGFSGVVPHHLGNLSRLQYLDLNSLYHVRLDRKDFTWCSSMSIDDLHWVPSLSSLKLLGLSGLHMTMNLTDELDWFSEVNMLPSLLTLNLAGCDINFPSITSVNFTSLNSLDLSDNFINSTIPVWLFNLTDLTHLELSINEFHGQIPDFLGTLSALASVDLADNSFDTLVPGLFWNLSSLTLLDLSYNEFHGLVPVDVKNLYQLIVLDLSGNRIVADLPSLIGSMSEFVAKSLVYLSLAENEFSGCIPNTIGDFKKLENLLLSRNTLYGHVPPSLGGLTSLKDLF